jgi:hypothetical protein
MHGDCIRDGCPLRYQSGPCSPSSWLPTKPLRSLRCTPRFGARADRQSRYLSIDFTLETVQSKGSIRSAGRFTPHLLHNRLSRSRVRIIPLVGKVSLKASLSRSGVLRSIGCFAAGAAGAGAIRKEHGGSQQGALLHCWTNPRGGIRTPAREARGDRLTRCPFAARSTGPACASRSPSLCAPLHMTPHTLEKTFFFARRVTLGSSVIRFPVMIVRCVADRRLRWRVGSGLGGHGRS